MPPISTVCQAKRLSHPVMSLLTMLSQFCTSTRSHASSLAKTLCETERFLSNFIVLYVWHVIFDMCTMMWMMYYINMMQYSFEFLLIFIFKMNCAWHSKATHFFWLMPYAATYSIPCSILLYWNFNRFHLFFSFPFSFPLIVCRLRWEFWKIKTKFGSKIIYNVCISHVMSLHHYKRGNIFKR